LEKVQDTGQVQSQQIIPVLVCYWKSLFSEFDSRNDSKIVSSQCVSMGLHGTKYVKISKILLTKSHFWGYNGFNEVLCGFMG